MSNNRTEQQQLVDAMAATVTIAELQAILIQRGYVFKKDVAVTKVMEGSSGSSILTLQILIKWSLRYRATSLHSWLT